MFQINNNKLKESCTEYFLFSETRNNFVIFVANDKRTGSEEDSWPTSHKFYLFDLI